jgi:hypothetical protein
VEKSSPKMWATYASFTKLPEVNNRPLGENSPNLVSLADQGPMFLFFGEDI